MRYAVIKNNKVVNVVEAEEGYQEKGAVIVASIIADIDDTYENGKFKKPVRVDKRTYKQKRSSEYPPIGDQLDAILKGFNQLRLNGTDLPADLDSIVNQWLAVKAKHQKPEEA